MTLKAVNGNNKTSKHIRIYEFTSICITVRIKISFCFVRGKGYLKLGEKFAKCLIVFLRVLVTAQHD